MKAETKQVKNKTGESIRKVGVLKGLVVRAIMNKTATVEVETKRLHPLYRKPIKKTKKYLAHDELGVKMGDVVEIIKTKPFSKRKHWQVKSVVGKRMEEIMVERLKEKTGEVLTEVGLQPKEEKEEKISVRGKRKKSKDKNI